MTRPRMISMIMHLLLLHLLQMLLGVAPSEFSALEFDHHKKQEHGG